VILNLVNNAIKFAPKRSDVVVEASLNEENSSLVVSVSDRGPGIAKQDITKLFK